VKALKQELVGVAFEEVLKVNANTVPDGYALIASNISSDPILTQCTQYEFSVTLGWKLHFDAMYLQQIRETTSKTKIESARLIVVFTSMHGWCRKASPIASENACLVKQLLNETLFALQVVRALTSAPICLLIPEIPSNALDRALVEQVRVELSQSAGKIPNIFIADIDDALRATGQDAFYNQREQFRIQMPYSVAAAHTIARQIISSVRNWKGSFKKCLALDCDGVLWGGTVDELGEAGIVLDTDYPGNAYYALQQEVVKLHKCGVLIVLLSKNDEQDIFNVMNHHPFMLLKKSHLAGWRINFKNKADNLIELANELKISTDSIVFLDDSLYEVELIRRVLPEVTSIHVEGNRGYMLADVVLKLDLFKTGDLTDDDLTRNQSFQQEWQRRRENIGFESFEAYIASLNMTLEPADVEQTAKRIAQLSQRTNRLNLTCQAYSQRDILDMNAREDTWISCYRLKDRFGDLGYICAIIVRRVERRLEFEGFFLSCRAMGRGVERMALDHMMGELPFAPEVVVTHHKDNGKNSDFADWVHKYFESRGIAVWKA
jgi:FkbH-like protein